MEGLKKRILVFAAIMFAFAIVIRAAVPRIRYQPKTEAWLEDRAPAAFDGYTFSPSAENPKQTYRMEQGTYDALQPYGIVSRVFSDGKNTFDTVLIAGAAGRTFHNPKACFTSQGYAISDTRKAMVKTKSHGEVPVNVVVVNSDKGTTGNGMAVFCYHSPLGFRADTGDLRKDLVISKVLRKPSLDGVFYRIISLTKETTPEETMAFVSKFLDAAAKSSDGYF